VLFECFLATIVLCVISEHFTILNAHCVKLASHDRFPLVDLLTIERIGSGVNPPTHKDSLCSHLSPGDPVAVDNDRKSTHFNAPIIGSIIRFCLAAEEFGAVLATREGSRPDGGGGEVVDQHESFAVDLLILQAREAVQTSPV
jgi:hypothetical protein